MAIPGERYLIEVPIYRQPQAEFERDYLEHRDGHLATLNLIPESELRDLIADRLFRDYPAPWRYNAVVGFVRVFMLWDQVRGDLWRIDSIGEGRRYRRQSRKRFEELGKAFEMHISAKTPNEEIAREIRRHLIEGGTLRHPKGTHVDTEVFDNIAPFVDWQAIRAIVEREWFSIPG